MLPPGFDLSQLSSLHQSISQLNKTLSASHQPSSIFIHAPTNPELVTEIVQQRLNFYSRRDFSTEIEPSAQDLLPKVVKIDLRELHSPRLIYDRILNLLAGWRKENGEGELDEESGMVENWNGRQEGLEIKSSERPSKRVRLNEEGDSRDGEEQKWSLEWNREVGQGLGDGLRRNESLDGFYQGLREVFTLGDGSKGKEQRRYLLFENAGYIEDLAGGGTNGAPKETGIGMTFAGALSRLGELVGLFL